jgi:hypothetical protein
MTATTGLCFSKEVYAACPFTLWKTKGAFKNGQSRENQRGIQEWTIQRLYDGFESEGNFIILYS